MSSVRDTDKGYSAMVARVFGARKAQIKVGVLEKEAAQPHKVAGARVEPSSFSEGENPAAKPLRAPPTVLDVATWMEFGVPGHILARSFVRAYVDENEKRIREMISRLMAAVIKGKYTAEQIVEIVGARMVGEMQKRISDRIAPALAASTVKRKGSDVPLIDTGQLRSSITYRATVGEGSL